MSFGSFNTFNTLIQSVKIFLNPPTIVIPTASSSTVVSVAFTAPGGTITSYTATSSPDGLTGTGTSSPITVSGLTPNTNYTFTVTATNSSGTSLPSSASSVTTRTISPQTTLVSFTSSGSFVVPSYLSSIYILLVAGGGAGGHDTGGGGGAGGYIYNSSFSVTSNTSYPIVIGAGGTPATDANGIKGGDSTFSTLTAIGGGGGAHARSNVALLTGGSGGGGGAVTGYASTPAGLGTAGQGFSGGLGSPTNNAFGGGGGGGGFVGGTSTNTVAGNGGNGIQNAISGTNTYYCGGGGSGTYVNGQTGGLGGFGGGGKGTSFGTNTQPNGIANTGGGGGGGGYAGTGTGSGGSGIVIISYNSLPVATVLSSSSVSVDFTAPSGGNGTIINYTVTSSPGGLFRTLESSPITVLGLTPNTPYTFSVTATNSGGTSLPSSASTTKTTISSPPTLIGGLLQQLLVNKPAWGRYSASSWVQGTLTLTDETGNGRHGVGTGALTQTSSSGNGATVSIPYIQGIRTDQIVWPTGSIASVHTICGITRYSSASPGNQNRILTSSTDNYVIGHHFNKRGVIYNGSWRTTEASVTPTLDWMNMCYTNNASGTNPIPNNILVNGVGKGTSTGGNGVVSALSINLVGQYPTETSDFQIAQLLIWNQALTPAELVIVSDAYTQFLATGIILPVTVLSSTTVSIAFTAPSGGSITSYTATSSPGMLNIIDISNLVLYYPFNSIDLNGSIIANWATGSPVYDASMTGTTTITSNQMSTLTAGTNQNGILINRNVPRTGFTGLTFSFWFTATSIPSSTYWFFTTLQDTLGFPSGNRFYITINPSNKLSINEEFITSLTVVVNTLYHIVVTINSTGTPNTTVYVNNVSQTGNCTYPTFTNVSGYNSIGRDPVGNGLLGTLDDYRLYNRSITASEVNTLFLAGTTSGASPISVSGASSPITISGLTPNTIYKFSVSATNSGGTSDYSIASTATTRTSAPTIGTATVSSSTAINVAFTAPSGSGTITNYTVTSSPGGLIGTGSSSPISVSGLTSNTSYTFSVTATNSGGISTASSQSITVTTPTFRVKSSTSVVPTSVDGYTLSNTSVSMFNDATRGFVFGFSTNKSLSINLATPINSTKTFWLSSSTPQNSDGNVFSTGKMPIYFNSTTFLKATVNFGGSPLANVISTLAQTITWTFYAITTTATTTTMYVNGTSVASANVTWTGDTGAMYFGSFTSGANNYNGNMDDIRFYSIILTPTEIQTLYINS